MTIPDYSSPLNLGHKDSQEFFDGLTYVVQEKVDGSQFSFGKYASGIKCRSHGQQIDLNNPGMFDKAVETVLMLADNLLYNFTYRGEYLRTRKHNKLAYDRTPHGNIILFDVETDQESFFYPHNVEAEARRLGIESAPYLDEQDTFPTQEMLDKWLDTTSILGGVKVEGVVLKSYRHIARDGKSLMVKYVSPNFRETQSDNWKKERAEGTGLIEGIIADFGSEARWDKTIQHLREDGKLTGTPSDIGPLMREFNEDFERECVEAIKQRLWQTVRKDVMRGVSKGLPNYYKQWLIEQMRHD